MQRHQKGALPQQDGIIPDTSRKATKVNDASASVGLCEECAHVRVIRSDRGSVFYLCRLAATDRRFARYPTLPVIVCSGYELAEETEGN